jgi:HPr kinase/phosphorylase
MAYSPSLTIGALLGRGSGFGGLELRLVAGDQGLERRVLHAAIQKTGLSLAGLVDFVHAGRVLIFGDSEVQYLASLAAPARREVLAAIFEHDVPCVLVTNGLEPPPELLDAGEAAAVPILLTSASTAAAITKITALLDDRLAPREIVHGVLLDILGLGTLMVGESGIGKSECGLDLVMSGHRLVADDAVEIRRRAESVLIGSCPELTRHHMEIRGIGLINIRDMFGVASTRRSKRVEFVVQLERWDPTQEYERLGLDDEFYELLGVAIPMVRMPVAPGRNLAVLTEVAARNQLLRVRGQHAARDLVARADRRIADADTALADDDDDDVIDTDGER